MTDNSQGPPPSPPAAWSRPALARPVLVALAAMAALLLLWRLRSVLLLVVGGLIVATALNALASLLARITPLSYQRCVALSVVGLVVLGGATGWLIGDSLVVQLSALTERLPVALRAIHAWIVSLPLGQRLLDLAGASANDNLSIARVLSAAGLTLGALGQFVLMLLIGVFVAAEPQLYRRGTLALLPPAHRALAGETLADCRVALARWLRGQGLSMLFVGTATGVGLMLLNVPLALSLGVIAGGLGFIPFFGAISSGLLAVLLAFSEGPRTAMHVAILCFAIQQLEGHLLMPFIQRWSVQLAPVLSILSVVMFGEIFGLLGVLLAVPLMVLLVVLVRKLHVDREGWRSSRES